MGASAKLLFWWVLFGGSHVLGSSVPVRTRLVQTLGVPGFKGLYSLVAFATFIPLCVVYARNKHAGAALFEPSSGLNHLAQVLMLCAFVVLFQGLMTPSPITTAAEMSGKYTSSARGIQRVTRHPLNTAFLLFGVAHSLVNPFIGDWIFFGGFVIYGIASALHQDARILAIGRDEAKQYIQDTSATPFGAILSGRQKLALGEYSVPGLVAALVVAVLLRLFHGRLFGGFGV